MRRTNAPAMPRPGWRQQFPHMSLTVALAGLHQQISMIQKGLIDGEFIEIDSHEHAREVQATLHHAGQAVACLMEPTEEPTGEAPVYYTLEYSLLKSLSDTAQGSESRTETFADKQSALNRYHNLGSLPGVTRRVIEKRETLKP